VGRTPEPEIGTVRAGGRGIPVRIFEGGPSAEAAVVIVPAMGVRAHHYDTFAAALAAAGRHAVTVELPGCGDSPVAIDRTSRIGYQDLIEVEVAAAVTSAERRWPSTSRVLVGHSLGGQLSLLYAAANPDRVEAVALPAAGTIHWRAYPLPAGLGVLAFTQLARLVVSIVGVFPGDRLGFGGRQPRQLIHDWAATAVTGRWHPGGTTVDYHRLLRELRLSVLSVTLEGDHLAPPSAAAALTSALPDHHVTHVHLSAGQLRGPTDHLRWLKAPEQVAAIITTWLTAQRDVTARPRTAQPA
jgi:predicted alpha/beta hydrolase